MSRLPIAVFLPLIVIVLNIVLFMFVLCSSAPYEFLMMYSGLFQYVQIVQNDFRAMF